MQEIVQSYIETESQQEMLDSLNVPGEGMIDHVQRVMQALQERRVIEVRQLPDLFGLLQEFFATHAISIERITSMNRETELAVQRMND